MLVRDNLAWDRPHRWEAVADAPTRLTSATGVRRYGHIAECRQLGVGPGLKQPLPRRAHRLALCAVRDASRARRLRLPVRLTSG